MVQCMTREITEIVWDLHASLNCWAIAFLIEFKASLILSSYSVEVWSKILKLLGELKERQRDDSERS